MLKIENVVLPIPEQMKAVIRGMRNPMNSWDKSDTSYGCGSIECLDNGTTSCDGCLEYEIGENDLDLMRKLSAAGTDHSKYLRMIPVFLDIDAPLYWWKEFDTYKVGTVANSCSTMHKIHSEPFTVGNFSMDELLKGNYKNEDYEEYKAHYKHFTLIIDSLNNLRDSYLKTKDKRYWRLMIEMLPSSYNQRRTVMLNYQVLKNIYKSRRNHKLSEWHTMCDWIESLPYSELITMKLPIGHDDEDDLK